MGTTRAYGAPCCGADDLFEQAWSGGGTCEYGMGGAHLEIWLTRGCETHSHYGARVRLLARHCPMDCEWSRLTVEPEWPDDDDDDDACAALEYLSDPADGTTVADYRRTDTRAEGKETL